MTGYLPFTKKAEQLKLEGQDIEIIDEFTFYDILKDEGAL